MEKEQLTSPGHGLPTYLGYGILDEKSVTSENGTLMADYVLDCDGSVVYSARLEQDCCRLETRLHGEILGTSLYKDLKQAFSWSFLSGEAGEEKIFNFLAHTASALGNIYIQLPRYSTPEKPRKIFYPAGLLMIFKLPLLEKTARYDSFIKGLDATPEIQLHREEPSYLLLVDKERNLIRQPLTTAVFVVGLAYMTRAARVFGSSGLITPGRYHRMTVIESDLADCWFQIFPGTGDYLFFATCSAIYLEEAEEVFRKGIPIR